jgi:hypothetical protein
MAEGGILFSGTPDQLYDQMSSCSDKVGMI